MVTLVGSAETCNKAGNGMTSTWTLSGQTTTYAGTYATASDGYKIVASMTWVDPGNTYTTAYGGTGETVNTNDNVGMGTCVATMTAAGTAELAATTTTEGNYALCHFIFWQSNTGSGGVVTLYAASTGTNDWGQSNYLNETQWGTLGAGVKGNGMRAGNSGGTAIATATYGHALSPAGASCTTTIPLGAKTFTWYQPKWASTYAATALRRYNGGGTEVEKVQAYCVSARRLDGTAHKSGGFVKTSAVSTLSGASVIAAGAIALGVAALAL